MRIFAVSPACQSVRNRLMACSEGNLLIYGHCTWELQSSSAGSSVFPSEKFNILHYRKLLSEAGLVNRQCLSSYLVVVCCQMIYGQGVSIVLWKKSATRHLHHSSCTSWNDKVLCCLLEESVKMIEPVKPDAQEKWVKKIGSLTLCSFCVEPGLKQNVLCIFSAVQEEKLGCSP